MLVFTKCAWNVTHAAKECFLALSLLMALALGANHHYSAVSLDHFALIAHRFYGRSYFHFIFSLMLLLLRIFIPHCERLILR